MKMNFFFILCVLVAGKGYGAAGRAGDTEVSAAIQSAQPRHFLGTYDDRKFDVYLINSPMPTTPSGIVLDKSNMQEVFREYAFQNHSCGAVVPKGVPTFWFERNIYTMNTTLPPVLSLILNADSFVSHDDEMLENDSFYVAHRDQRSFKEGQVFDPSIYISDAINVYGTEPAYPKIAARIHQCIAFMMLQNTTKETTLKIFASNKSERDYYEHELVRMQMCYRNPTPLRPKELTE
jgi:hypothetical protein